MEDKPKQILVTGGAGFLGSHLCKQLLERGHKVLCLDNFYTGKKVNLASCLASPHFEIIQHDVCSPFSFEVDAIYHLACPASPPHYQRDPIYTTKTSVLGALHVLTLAQRRNIPILFSSTSEIYGDPEQHPQKESYWGRVHSIGPRACYDEGKRCAESLFMDYHRMHKVDIRIARIFNTYGPHMCPQDGRVISNFITQALSNQPITIYGTGKQTRSLCYVEDLVSGLIQLMETPHLHSPVNLGNPAEKTIHTIAEKIIQLTHSASNITYHPLPIDDPQQRCPDITKAQSLLHWTPSTSLELGLQKTIDYFQTLAVKHDESQTIEHAP